MAEQQSPTRKRPLVPALIAVVAALVTAAFIVVPQVGGEGSTGGTSTEAPADAGRDASSSEAATMARRMKDDPMALGRADAPVVLVEYSDFQCPFCGRFARTTAPVLIRKYVEKGTLRIEWRDFPYLGPESRVGARAGRAAAEQGRFWELHDAMYADQQPRTAGGSRSLTLRASLARPALTSIGSGRPWTAPPPTRPSSVTSTRDRPWA